MKTITTQLEYSYNYKKQGCIYSVICSDFVRKYLNVSTPPEEITLTISDEPFENSTKVKLHWYNGWMDMVEVNNKTHEIHYGLGAILEDKFPDKKILHFNIKPTK